MRLGRNFVIYLASSLTAGFLPLMLMPYLTKQLTPEDYGVMITVTTLILVVMPMVSWGAIPYLGVEYFRTDQTIFGALFSTLLIVPVITTLSLVGLAVLAAPWIAALMDLPQLWVPVIPVMAAGFFIPMATLNLLRMLDLPFGCAWVELSSTALNFGLTIFLIFAAGLAWEGRILAVFGANLLISIAAFWWLMRQGYLGQTFTPTLLAPALRFGAGVVLHDLANQSMRLADRLIVSVVIGQTALGAYGVATQIATVMLVMLGALNRAWTPLVFATLAEDTEAARIRLVRRSYLVYLALLGFFTAFNLATPFIYDLLVDSRYYGAQPAVFWLTLGFLFNGFYLTVVDHIFYLKKTHLLAAITVLNASASLTLAYVLADNMGVVGVPIAFAVTSGVVMVVVFGLVQWLSPLPWLRAIAA